MRYRLLLILKIVFFALLPAIQCSLLKGDCRKNDSCPIFFTERSTGYVNENGEYQLDSIPEGSRITILTDLNGEFQSTKKFSLDVKCLFNDRVVYLLALNLPYNQNIYVLNYSGVNLYEKPDSNSKILAKLRYSDLVVVKNVTRKFSDPEGFILVKNVNGSETGWAHRKNFTDSDYNPALHNKTIHELMEKYSIIAVNEDAGITLTWKGSKFEDLDCSLKNLPCSPQISFESQGESPRKEKILILISTESQRKPSHKCEIDWSGLVDFYKYIENNKLDAYLSCEELE
ncbi:hypothetical protein CH365_05890 [Leptospira neocaledonica]|uniref:Uncharacterized protein n=1 Tax=Leptospira neocaledonica TaxID=2023192 RepID=A0A2N0A0Y2_9LEPT|nr:hypothetical protein CH365_05890 [Leptospira neocaledonica]